MLELAAAEDPSVALDPAVLTAVYDVLDTSPFAAEAFEASNDMHGRIYSIGENTCEDSNQGVKKRWKGNPSSRAGRGVSPKELFAAWGLLPI